MSKKRYLDFEKLLINEGYKERYREYLITKGLKIKSSTGQPSTVYDYVNWVNRIIKKESITWQELANNIQIYLPKYNIGGKEEGYGQKSNNSAISALRYFSKFITEKVLNS